MFLELNSAIVSPYLCAHIQIPLSDFMMMMPHMNTYSNRVIEKESMKAYLCFIYIEQLHQDTASIVHDTNDGNYSCQSKDATDGIIVLLKRCIRTGMAGSAAPMRVGQNGNVLR